jgi:hypothetical protein
MFETLLSGSLGAKADVYLVIAQWVIIGGA